MEVCFNLKGALPTFYGFVLGNTRRMHVFRNLINHFDKKTQPTVVAD